MDGCTVLFAVYARLGSSSSPEDRLDTSAVVSFKPTA